MMKRRHFAIAGVAVTAAAAGGGFAWWRSRPPAVPDQPLWSMRFDQPAGGELAMSSFQGHPLLLNFWATWCPPCVKEMPMLDAFLQQHRATGWQVVGLAVDGPTPVREFLSKRTIGFPVGLAGMNGVELAHSLGNDGGGLPFSIVFDSHGRVAQRKLGSVKEEDLAAWVAQVK